MTTVELIFDHGVFRPTKPVSLPDGTRVSVNLTEPGEGASGQVSFVSHVIPAVPLTPADRLAIVQRIIDLPEPGPSDGFSGAAHDDILYRRDW
ncbi:MAG: antitoxin family protein [Phycisphaerae bacterium]